MNPRELMHGCDFDGSEGDLSGSYVTEKFDGWRVRWTGARLFLRSGKALHAPDWFTEGAFPAESSIASCGRATVRGMRFPVSC